MMNRRNFLATAGALTLASPLFRLLAYGAGVLGGQAQLIRNGVGYYTNRGGTIGCYQPEAAAGGVVVDTQFPDAAKEFVAEVWRSGERLDLFINTHHHGDHTGGNGEV